MGVAAAAACGPQPALRMPEAVAALVRAATMIAAMQTVDNLTVTTLSG